MLVEAIQKEFNTYFELEPHHTTVLWFDPKREWEGLLPFLKSHLNLLVFQGSLLELRYRLVSRSPGEKTVVYLPMKQEEAAYLRPFFYTAKIFEQSIEILLHHQGVTLPQAPKVMQSLRPLLPALAVASVGKGDAFWKEIVNLETALARLLPDFEHHLLQLLAQPQIAMSELRKSKIDAPFMDLVKSQFGVEPPRPGEEPSWAERFTALLCLVDLYLSANKPADFPFASILPNPVHWERCRNFLQKWQRDELFKPNFAQRAKAIDAAYALGDWVVKLPQAPLLTSALLNVEKALWESSLKQLSRVSSKEEAVAYCRDHSAELASKAQGFWAREGSLPGWVVLASMSDVVIGADDALAEVSQYKTSQAMITRYAGSWWQVDQAYRRFRARLDQGIGGMDAALKWTQRIYQNYLDTVNHQFVEAAVSEGIWPPAGSPLGLSEYWQSLQVSDASLKALVLVDGLRYELGQELAARLEQAHQVTPEFIISTLPTITPLGMAALLPGSEGFQANFQDGKWEISAPRFSGNLAEKAHRLAWLQAKLPKVAFYDLEQWLSTPLSEVEGGLSWIVVSSTEIDAVGEGAGTVSWHTFEPLLDRIEQTVRRLLAAGCSEVHVASDHGFLLRENLREADKVSVNVTGVLKKAERYLIGRGLPSVDLPCMQVTWSKELQCCFPRGIGCFVTPGPYNYMHGGVSLQEVLGAHVLVRQTIMERPIKVGIELVSGAEIRNAIFKVRLIPQDLDLWSRSRKVDIDIARQDTHERVSEVWELEVHREALEKSLRLEASSGLAFGSTVTVRVWDHFTRELIAQVPAKILVDLDL